MTSPADARTIIIERTLDAPRERVWAAWTEPDAIAQWWGPEGFTTRVEQLEFRVGGRTRYVMIAPDGAEYPVEGTFIEIVPGERIVTTDEFGEDFDPKTFDRSALPKDTRLTITMRDADDGTPRTIVTLRLEHPNEDDRRKHEAMGVVGGWNSSIDCLEAFLRGD